MQNSGFCFFSLPEREEFGLKGFKEMCDTFSMVLCPMFGHSWCCPDGGMVAGAVCTKFVRKNAGFSDENCDATIHRTTSNLSRAPALPMEGKSNHHNLHFCFYLEAEQKVIPIDLSHSFHFTDPSEARKDIFRLIASFYGVKDSNDLDRDVEPLLRAALSKMLAMGIDAAVQEYVDSGYQDGQAIGIANALIRYKIKSALLE